ncbi:hypothetical protein ACFSFY_07010 [Sporosarcina siberiensis]|uniref:Uncharacterized protein n=1 Tax=Sporosarcina siberiensis TaxID=1365606 RepID=A0ABW4SFQ9_9BACL
MKAYLVNKHYIFTEYNDLSDLIHDIIHYTDLKMQQESHSFTICTGKIQLNRMVFIADNGQCTRLLHDSEDNLYYSLDDIISEETSEYTNAK